MNLAWGDLFAGLSILMVLEGLLPFLNPGGARRVFAQLASLSERDLRVGGLVSMLVGLVLLFFVRS
ncbi:MAG: DUF2065 domain-containing protein [Pseudomonadota bacterium]